MSARGESRGGGRLDADVIVVGGGTAGSVVAARLSEDPGRRVLLLEAGPAPETADAFPGETLDGTTISAAVSGHPFGWTYRARFTPGDAHMPDREYDLVRGRILGGSSAVNGGAFLHPRPRDLARWAADGGPGWAAESALPLLAGATTDLDHPEHGASGPIPVRRAGADHPAARALVDAAIAAGHPSEPDKNAGAASGVGPVPQTVVDGVRRNAAMGYVLPALGRANLTVRGGARVRRVVLEGDRAAGVELDDGIVRAREIVLSGGAIATPHLLLVSGVGPAGALAEHGVRCVADLPVGLGFSDHPSVMLTWDPRPGVPSLEGAGPFATALHLTAPSGGELELLAGLRPLSEILPGLDAPAQFPLMVNLPASGGRVTLRSARPEDPPLVEYRYLATPAERADARAGVRAAAALLRSADFSRVSAGDDAPAPGILADDTALDGWIAARIGTTVHTCGTAPMGDGPDAVTDGAGRVHGVRGLRVADTSLLPRVPERGPAASAILVGEVVARAMLS